VGLFCGIKKWQSANDQRNKKLKLLKNPVGRPKGSISHSATYDRCRVISANELLKSEGFKRNQILTAINDALHIGEKKAETAMTYANKNGVHCIRLSEDDELQITDQDLIDAIFAYLTGGEMPRFNKVTERARISP
jgi:hypothetical protein